MMISEDEEMELRSGLNLVLYELYHLDAIKDAKFDKSGAKYYLRMPLEKRLKIKRALDWALENKEQNFNKFLPNQQHIENDDIIQLFSIIKNGFEEFGICSA